MMCEQLVGGAQVPQSVIRVYVLSALRVEYKQDWCQQLMHPLTIAEVTMLFSVAEQYVHHHGPAEGRVETTIGVWLQH